jgi:hypothetical protein
MIRSTAARRADGRTVNVIPGIVASPRGVTGRLQCCGYMECTAGSAMIHQHRIADVLRGCLVAALWSGCGTTNDAKPDAAPAPSDATATACSLDRPLTCSSLTMCTNYTVRVFHAALPSPAGGEIQIGAYRLSYVLYPPGMGDAIDTEPGDDELAFGTQDFLHVSRDAATSGIGTYTRSGSGLSWSYAQSCGASTPPATAFSECGATSPSPTPPSSASDAYTAAARSISIFRNAPGGWPAMYVYAAVVTPDGTVGAQCSDAAADPAAPGESLRCRASDFCVCERHADLAIDCTTTSSG